MNALDAKDSTSSQCLTSQPIGEVESRPILRNPLGGFILLLLAVTCTRIALQLFTPLNLSPDEAHYWEWSRRLDWSYYSKGPVVAWLIALGTTVWGDTQWGVRFPALLNATALMVGMYWFLAKNIDTHIAFWSVALLHSGVFFFSLGLGMTTDAPCLFAWFLALVFAYGATFSKEPFNSWQWAGMFAGIAALSKYTAVIIFPAFFLTFLVVPTLRSQLCKPSFWLGWGMSIIALFPVIFWNYRHGWVNFLHNSNHLIPQNGSRLRAEHILEVFLACAFMVGPLLVCVLAHFIWNNMGLRMPRHYPQNILARICFFLIPGLCLVGVCLAVALQKRVYPNWIAPAFLYLTIASAFAWKHTDRNLNTYQKWVKAGLILNSSVVIVGITGVLGFTWGLPPSRLPTKKLIGWRELGAAVGTLTKNLGNTRLPIVADSYEVASELAFYTPANPAVYCARIDERRMNQYDIWGGWNNLMGETVLLVLRSDHVPESLSVHFKEVKTVGSPFSVTSDGDILRTFYFFVGTGYDGAEPENGKFF